MFLKQFHCVNKHAVAREACSQCGNCCTGRKNESLSAIYSEGSFTWTNTHTRTQNDLIGFNAGSQNKINVKKFCTSFFYVSFAIKRTKSSEFSFVLFDNKKLYGETKIMLS